MDNYFRDAFEGLKQTAEGLITAHTALAAVNEALITANQGIKKATESALHARDEHEDLRETVRRLETLVEDLIRKQNEGR